MFTASSLRNNFHHTMQFIVNWTSNGQICFFEVELRVKHLGFLDIWVTTLPLNSLAIKMSSELQLQQVKICFGVIKLSSVYIFLSA